MRGTLVLAMALLGGQIAAPAPTGAVTGRIVDVASGEPIPGTTVSLSPVQPSGARATVPASPVSPNLLRSLTNSTNTDGAFEISGVPSGLWRVEARKEGYIPFAATLEVRADAVRLSDVRMDRGGAIEGRVLDGHGAPMVRVLVSATQQVRNRDGTVRFTGGAGGTTNDLGEFRVSGLAPGQYTVRASPPASVVNPFAGGSPTAAPATYVPTFYSGSSEVEQGRAVTVSRGLTTRGIEFSMLLVPSYQVFGVVVDSSGRPVGGAAVHLAPARSSLAATGYQGSPSALDGTFVIVNVPDGRYFAQAAMPLVTRRPGGMSASLSFRPAGGPDSVAVVVQGANVQGVRLVATPP